MTEKRDSVHFPSKRNGERTPQPCGLKEVLRGHTGADWCPLIGHRPSSPTHLLLRGPHSLTALVMQRIPLLENSLKIYSDN